MAIRGRVIALGVTALVALMANPLVGWSQDIPNPDLKTISPVFEGWEKNPDGTYFLYFGYYNRNAQEWTVPIGPANSFSPAPADRVQPTNFLPGRGRNAFRIKEPAGWNDKAVWTLEVAGAKEVANGTVADLYEIAVDEDTRGNKAPTVEGGSDVSAKVGEAVPLSAAATDDGKPKRQGKSRLTVSWNKYRGPATKIVFTKNDLVTPDGGGQVSTTATFSAPGTYVVRVTASDSNLAADDFVTVAVK